MRTFPPKQYRKCKRVKPRTEAYFDRKASGVHAAFLPNCKACRAESDAIMAISGDAFLHRMADQFRPVG